MCEVSKGIIIPGGYNIIKRFNFFCDIRIQKIKERYVKKNLQKYKVILSTGVLSMNRKDDVISTKQPKLTLTNQKQSVLLYMYRDLDPIFHVYEYEEGIREFLKIAAYVVSEFELMNDAYKSIDLNVSSDLFFISDTQKQNDVLTIGLKIYNLNTCLVPRDLRGLTFSLKNKNIYDINLTNKKTVY